MPIVDAVILAGGFGTRLRPLTAKTPKPLLSVGGRPFLETLFFRLAQGGVKRVVLSVFHQTGVLKAALPKLRRFGLRVQLRQEPKPLGTGGAIRYAWPDPKRATLVLNGDVLTDYDLRHFQKAHAHAQASASLWVIPVPDPSAFGVLEFGADGRVTRFVEKPRPGESESRHINAGLYALEPAVRSIIAADRPVSVERETFPHLLQAGQRVQAVAAAEAVYWNDIGTPVSYLQAHVDILNHRLWKGAGPAVKLWGRQDKRGSLRGKGAKIAASALVSQSVLGAGCQVAASARIEASVLLDKVFVGEGAQMQGVIIGPGSRIGARAVLKPGAVLGAGTLLPDDSKA
jgi:mannose-1-phosphate guanylyltransferase